MDARRSGHAPQGLKLDGVQDPGTWYWNLPSPRLVEEAVRRREGRLAHLGPLVVRTGQHTGRSPEDKFIVREPSSSDKVWWGKAHRPMAEGAFDALYRRVSAHYQGRQVFVQDCFAGADPEYRLPIRVVTETAWHSLFAHDMFVRGPAEERARHVPALTVLHAPNFHAVPELDGTRSEVFVAIHFGRRLVLIGGTHYAGEIKKSVFTVLNYLLPQRLVLSMHCSANIGPADDVAIFFGLSGTGKTTLSADPGRSLIGDDEHGWSERGIFNLEGGCYAKVIRLARDAEPEIYETTRRFGTILENVGFDGATGRLDLEDDALTENTRAAYPISHVTNARRDGMGGHPKNIVMLTCDAFGVLPPIAKLTPAQAMYHFLSGYTAKVAGTEQGVKEPGATFSTCFGAPFMALPPTVYADLLGEKIARHGVKVWLVNTGWSGGPYGVGRRIPIAFTRAVVDAALSGALDDQATVEDPTFGVAVPTTCPGVPPEILRPRTTWADATAYDAQARRLAAMFADNFRAEFEHAGAEVLAAAPKADR